MQFMQWVRNIQNGINETVIGYLEELLDMFNEPFDHEHITDLVNTMCELLQDHVSPLLSQFREEGRNCSATFKVWDDYLTRVSTPLKMFLYGTRNGKWTVYQLAKACMLPFIFASNSTTYALYLPVMLLLIKRLPEDIKQDFSHSLFVAKLAEGRYNGMWIRGNRE
jgi:hypothetical protein